MSSEITQKFNCVSCDKFYKNKRRLDLHNRVVHQGLKLKCELCDKKFTHTTNFQSHIKFEHKEAKGLFRCPKCENSYNHPSNLHQHIQTIHEGRRNKCDWCSKTFIQPNGVRRHKRNVHGIRDFYCEICGEVYTKISQLKRHKKNAHGESTSLLLKSNVHGGKKRKCKYCILPYSQHHNLPQMENGGKIQIGPTTVGIVGDQNGAEKILQCCFCYKKKFTKVIRLRMHILRVHENPKDFKCEYCEKLFSAAGNLKQHIETVHKGKKFKCDYCGKLSTKAGHLRTHIKTIHEGIKPEKNPNLFQIKVKKRKICTICGRSCNKFQRHMDTFHNNDSSKSIKKGCHICGQFFHNLANHIRNIHGNGSKMEKNRSLPCNLCNKLYTKHRLENDDEELNDIKNGIKNDIKNDKLVFKCCSDSCEKTFSVAHNLKLHILSVHEGIRRNIHNNGSKMVKHCSLPCNLCNKLYTKHG